MLGPSGTGKSVFLKTLVGLLKPDAGSIWIEGKDSPGCASTTCTRCASLRGALRGRRALRVDEPLRQHRLPLREHTRKNEGEIRRIVSEKIELVGLQGAEGKLPGEISGGMRKRGPARALVLDPEIILFDEPDSGLDLVRTAYLNAADRRPQRPDRGDLHRHPRHQHRPHRPRQHRPAVPPAPGDVRAARDAACLEEPVVRQFLNAQRVGPIGMSEEKDADGSPPSPARTAAAAADRAAARAQRRLAAPHRPPGRGVVPCERRDPAPRLVPDRQRRRPGVNPARELAGVAVSNPAIGALRQSGVALRARPRRPPGAAEAAVPDQGVHPAVLVHRLGHHRADGAGPIPFGAVIALQLGTLTRQLGAQSFTGAASWPSSGRPRRSSPPC